MHEFASFEYACRCTRSLSDNATNLYVSVNNAAFRVNVKEPKATSTAKRDLKSLNPRKIFILPCDQIIITFSHNTTSLIHHVFLLSIGNYQIAILIGYH